MFSAKAKLPDSSLTERELLGLECRVCSYGDTVHDAEEPKIFERCEGSYLYDLHGTPYLDLQMWYSAVNIGDANPQVAAALHAQIDRLPQLACRYLHREKIELAEMICDSVQRGFGMRQHPEIGDVDGLGLALRMEMCHPDGIAPWRELADRMFQIGLAGDLQIRGTTMGLVLDICGYYKNVITLAPSLEITSAEIDLAAVALDLFFARAKAQLGARSLWVWAAGILDYEK
jgi:4-aminobutyrate aminotransferase-like enzyme